MTGSAISTGARNITMMLAGRGIAGIGAAGILAVNFLFHSIFHKILTHSYALFRSSV